MPLGRNFYQNLKKKNIKPDQANVIPPFDKNGMNFQSKLGILQALTSAKTDWIPPWLH